MFKFVCMSDQVLLNYVADIDCTNINGVAEFGMLIPTMVRKVWIA